MENINKPGAVYIEQLTWLRGIAAFFVIVSHTFRATEVKYSETDEPSSFFLLSLFDLGHFGVVLFFVLSGCTLYISNSHKFEDRYIHKFYINRIFRIWPAFVVSIIIYACFSPIFSSLYLQPHGHWIEKQFLSSYSIYDIFYYLTLTFNISGPDGLFNSAYWSLPVEFQYYVIFPFIVSSIRFVGLLGPVLIGLALFLIPMLGLITLDKDAVFTLGYSFCGGVLIGHFYLNSSFRINKIFGLISLATLFTLVSSISNSYVTLPDIPIISGKWYWYIGIGIASVFIVLFTKVNIHNKVESFLKHYGTISYSTYLYHNLFIAIAILFIIKFDIYDSNIRLFLTLIFTLITSYIAAFFSYKYIEKPSIAIGRKILTAKYNKSNAADAKKHD